MKSPLRLLLLLLLPTFPACGAVYEIGGQKIDVPTPYAYVAANPEKARFAALQQLTADKHNDTAVLFLTLDDADAVQSDGTPELTHYCLVKHTRSMGSERITYGDFATIKATLKDRTAKFWADAAKSGDGDLSAERLDKLVLRSDVVPMDPHAETDLTIAYSALVKYNKGQESESVVAVTITLMNVNGTFIQLYVYAPRDELEASRDLSHDWSDAVLKGNNCVAHAVAAPAPVVEARPENATTSEGGIDWKRWIEGLLVAAVAGTVTFVACLLLDRRRNH